MRKTKCNKLFFILCTVLIAATALCSMGCAKTGTPEPSATAAGEPTATAYSYTPAEEIGNGSKKLWVNVVHKDGSERSFCVKTDKENVGEALEEAGIIVSKQSASGMYTDTVDGETLDFDKDKMYWAFYVNDEYAVTSMDKTEINEYITYTLKAQS